MTNPASRLDRIRAAREEVRLLTIAAVEPLGKAISNTQWLRGGQRDTSVVFTITSNGRDVDENGNVRFHPCDSLDVAKFYGPEGLVDAHELIDDMHRRAAKLGATIKTEIHYTITTSVIHRRTKLS